MTNHLEKKTMRLLNFLRMTGVLLLSVVALAMASVSTAQAQGILDRIQRDKVVKIGYSLYPPLIDRDPKTGEMTGYFVDAANYIFGELGVKIEYSELSFANLIASIQSGAVDLSIADSFMTVRRAAAIDFTRPLLFVGESFVVRKDEERFSQIEDLNQPEVKIAVLQGGSGAEFVRRALPNAQLIELNTTNKAAPFLEVAAGRADAGLNDSTAAKRYLEQDPNAKSLLKEPFNIHPSAWVVKKGEADFLNFVNASLNYLIFSGKFQEMAAQYPDSGQYIVKSELVPFP
ncbi:substrate-binding periplasmic protein [Pseudochelatococcus sp. B33]